MKAIITKYHGPSNVRGSRISASDIDKNKIIMSYDYAINHKENHQKAALALIEKMGWRGTIIGGAIESGYAWVFVD